MKKLFYFGCMREAGHYLWETEHSTVSGHFVTKFCEENNINPLLLQNMDGMFPPASRHSESFKRCSIPPVYIIAWWDYTVDKRPGSNSAFVAVNYVENFDIILHDAKLQFPTVIKRNHAIFG